jgi:DNA-binding MarR family transcriptional regulator/GNAT superfamily N-acetyltransferase
MNLIADLGELALATRLKRLSDRLQQNVSRIYREHEMTFRSRWFPVLLALSRQAPQSISELARALGLTHTAINQIAAEMSLEGLLVSRRDPQDDRRRLLSLSPEGDNAVVQLTPLWREIRAANAELIAESGHDLVGAIAAVERLLDQRSMYRRVRDRLTAGAVEIVDFRPDLAPDFRRLNLAWLEEHFAVEPEDREILDHPGEVVVDRGGIVLFALREGEAVGTCALLRHRDTVWELAKMAVAESCRRKGIGRFLTTAALARAGERGATIVFLRTSPRLEAATRLYRSLGFEQVDEPPVELESYSRCSITMQREI